VKPYLDLLRAILAEGSWQNNRTGIRSLAISGAMLKFDLTLGAPTVTTKKLFAKSAAAELCGFLRGATSAADFRALGTRIWDDNANKNDEWLANPNRAGEDDLGPVYGAQWRRWRGYRLIPANSPAFRDAVTKGWHLTGLEKNNVLLFAKEIDQLRECADKLVKNPTDRRILFSGWNPAELDQMALAPCHITYQFNANVAARELSMTFWMRSIDSYLGLPFNVWSATMLLTLMARLTGFTPRWLTWFGSDVHIYENQLDAIWPEDFETTLTVPAPKLFIVRADDQADIDLLKNYYPSGYLVLHSSPYEGKSFYSFVIPPDEKIERPLN
jgi:thymidylate synthase